MNPILFFFVTFWSFLKFESWKMIVFLFHGLPATTRIFYLLITKYVDRKLRVQNRANIDSNLFFSVSLHLLLTIFLLLVLI